MLTGGLAYAEALLQQLDRPFAVTKQSGCQREFDLVVHRGGRIAQVTVAGERRPEQGLGTSWIVAEECAQPLNLRDERPGALVAEVRRQTSRLSK